MVVNEIHVVGAAVPETENDPSVVRHKRSTSAFFFFESAWSISMCARCASTENCQAVFFSLPSIPFPSFGTGNPISSAFTGERPDYLSLRASNDHRFIVGVPRAQGIYWSRPSPHHAPGALGHTGFAICLSSSWGVAWLNPQLRASNEGLPILPTSLKGVAKAALYCAHGTSIFLSCAFCEQEGHLAAFSPYFSRICFSFSIEGGLVESPTARVQRGSS